MLPRAGCERIVIQFEACEHLARRLCGTTFFEPSESRDSAIVFQTCIRLQPLSHHSWNDLLQTMNRRPSQHEGTCSSKGTSRSLTDNSYTAGEASLQIIMRSALLDGLKSTHLHRRWHAEPIMATTIAAAAPKNQRCVPCTAPS